MAVRGLVQRFIHEERSGEGHISVPALPFLHPHHNISDDTADRK